MKEGLTLGDEHTIQYTDDVLYNHTPETSSQDGGVGRLVSLPSTIIRMITTT